MVAGLEEGLFPLGTSAYELEELEEERRLFYVALTRAEQKVYLSYANARRRFGGAPIACTKSRFIHELPEELVDVMEKPSVSSYTSERTYGKISSISTDGEYAIGDEVEHKLFGRGKILAIEGSGDTAKLTIRFSGNIRKKLILKYAKLVQLQK